MNLDLPKVVTINKDFDFSKIPLNYENLVWEITENHDLQGKDIVIPSNVKLSFKGGCFTNYKTLNLTSVEIEPTYSHVFQNNITGKVLSEINPRMFGAKGDGITDDSIALNNMFLTNGVVNLEKDGEYYIENTVNINLDFVTVKGNNSVFKASDNLLVAVKIGSTNINSRNVIENLTVLKANYNGNTENIGFLFEELNQSYLKNLQSRYFKYNFKFCPSKAGNAYNTYTNLQGIGGYYNFWISSKETGWCNENLFLGGRGFCTKNTNTNLYIENNGNGVNHNKFLFISLEGKGVQGIYDDGRSNVFEHNRSEGNWSSGYFHVMGLNCQYSVIQCARFDYKIDRSNSKDDRSNIISYRSGSKMSTANNGLTTLTLENQGDTDNSTLDTHNKKDNDTSYVFRAYRKVDSLLRSYLTTNGILSVGRSLRSMQSSWVYKPLKLGKYTLWVHNDKLYMKNGEPENETDGTIVGDQD